MSVPLNVTFLFTAQISLSIISIAVRALKWPSQFPASDLLPVHVRLVHMVQINGYVKFLRIR